MDLYEVSGQVVALLQKRGRLAYSMLKRQFGLDDGALEDLKDDLLFTYPQIVDDDGQVLFVDDETLGQLYRGGGFGVHRDEIVCWNEVRE